MIIGYTHHLRVSRTDPDTIWLAHPNVGDDTGVDDKAIPLPFDEAMHAQVGDQLKVFVYSDTQANPVATTKIPVITLGQCACLKVRSSTELGAFLEWGIDKDLLLPFNEQRRPVQEGNKESVLVYLDNSGRLAASSRLDKHLNETDDGFAAWQKVSLLIFQRTDLGFKAVVDDRAIGLLYNDEIFSPIRVGQTTAGYIKRLRQDHRIDLALQPPSDQIKAELTDIIMQYMEAHDGVSMLTDKSDPEAIYAQFGVSKKNFKRALSALYKQRRIVIEDNHVRLTSNAK